MLGGGTVAAVYSTVLPPRYDNIVFSDFQKFFPFRGLPFKRGRAPPRHPCRLQTCLLSADKMCSEYSLKIFFSKFPQQCVRDASTPYGVGWFSDLFRYYVFRFFFHRLR